MNLSTGVDLIEIERIRQAIDRHGERFLNKTFTPGEQAQAGGKPASLAARFAAKEAAAKALGTGIGEVGWLDIEVVSIPSGEPMLKLHGHAQKLAAELGYKTWSLSLSHSRGLAIAMVVALGECTHSVPQHEER
ncbi:MAG: holo-[acyl-carrier-protein] synthase [Chloroflexota bacterium]|nr:MAG: holo-[acyl-carrier-protein] synthase [Chloroflexota bacterium]